MFISCLYGQVCQMTWWCVIARQRTRAPSTLPSATTRTRAGQSSFTSCACLRNHRVRFASCFQYCLNGPGGIFSHVRHWWVGVYIPLMLAASAYLSYLLPNSLSWAELKPLEPGEPGIMLCWWSVELLAQTKLLTLSSYRNASSLTHMSSFYEYIHYYVHMYIFFTLYERYTVCFRLPCCSNDLCCWPAMAMCSGAF